MRRIIFISNGGLGNQLFQFSYLIKNYSNKELLLFGFNDLPKVFNMPKNIKIISSKGYLNKLLIRGVLKISLNFISKLRIIKTLIQKRIDNIETLETTEYNGIFNQIIFIKDSYFQSESFIPTTIKKTLKFKPYLSEIRDKTFNSNYVFIHYRGGDFNEYKPLGTSVILPEKYFDNAISYLNKRIKEPTFVIFGNEKFPYEYLLKNYKVEKINRSCQYEDFYLMSQFENAILSPSTFSWWASYFMMKKNLILVPKYWLGFNSKKYYPNDPIANYMTEIEFL